jgi:hypothetical protein
MDSIPVDIEAAAASVRLFRKAMLTTGSFIRISLALPITFFFGSLQCDSATNFWSVLMVI